MSKKDTSIKRLTAEQYWEWRTTIAEMNIKKSELKNSELELKNIQKDIELMTIKYQLFIKTRIESCNKSLLEHIAEYDRFKLGLEKVLGISLNNKVINDLTFEISDLPEKHS